ncbi:DUF2827 domain-containing protein [Trinickia violacea]|uniref:DUF2827 domain-containing protein n=1 Tax=Trinickia violacea TaxID=2571746 RepID=A0A4P8IYN2_9BURK|nr:DUF2827 domain-containing protein [Trinickia violacea]QCP54452.1 DUF2827 domain-containing protein [Trinickia violacea]
MRIGISVVTHDGQNIWQNGLGQNVIFLAEVFGRLPFVRSVVLIDVGDQRAMPAPVDLDALNLRIMTLREATDEVDVVVEMGGALDIQWLDLMRARGKKVVFYCCGQPYVGLAEPVVFNKPTHAARPDRCDEVWLLPKDALLAPLMRTLHRCPVYEVPYIWHPQFLEQRIQELTAHGYEYGYRDRASDDDVGEGLRVAVFEPNISVVKASSIPMLICDEAYRENSGSVKAIHVLNTLHMKDHMTMLHFANSLDLVRQHKATFHGRHDIAGFMVQHANAVVSHQWGNDQNYSYLDVLYGDYPLIHNSPWLRDAGYYYPGFDILEGARQLLRAATEHSDGIDDYRKRSKRVFDDINPFSGRNLEMYADRLRHLCEATPFPVKKGGA